MFEQSSSSKSNKKVAFLADIAIFLAVFCQGCAVVGRTQVDISRVQATNELGGPYYVIDATGTHHLARKMAFSEMLHDACQERYPSLFSKSRKAVPLLVSRQSRTKKSNSGFSFSYFLPACSLFILPALPQTAVIADRIDVSLGEKRSNSDSFTSKETFFVHVLTTYPFNSVLFPRSKGWGKETDDQAAPNVRVNETRQAAFADAIVRNLASMDEANRASLQDNAEAWARYYEVRPFVVGRDLVPQTGKIIHEIKIERPSATARIPLITNFSYDRKRRVGFIECDFRRCDPMFAQKWTFHRLLPERLREDEPLPGKRAVLIRTETLTGDGFYKMAFSVVE